ncbi:MAG: hypothetical protein RIR46_1342 [Actinomycetota bacterium]
MQALIIETAAGQKIQTSFYEGGSRLAVWHHGTPNPRELSADVVAAFTAHGYSVAAIIRPGYGESSLTRTDGQNMAEISNTTAAVVAHLGFNEFVSFGHSSGGARALADAAQLPGLLAAVTLATVAPVGEPDLNQFADTDPEELEMLEATKTITPELVAQFDKWAPSFENPFAFKNGAMGWALDEHSMMVPWGFEPASITKPVFLFSGEADPNVNPICSKWLAGKIAGATLTLLPNRDHDQIASAEVVEQALSALDAAL